MIDELHTFLTANKPTGVETVKKGWDDEALLKERELLPAIYIAMGDEDLEETDHDFVTGYWATQHVTIVIVCLISDLDSIKTAVRNRTLGWSQGATYTSLQPAGAQVINRKGNVVYWAENYFNEYQGTTAQ